MIQRTLSLVMLQVTFLISFSVHAATPDPDRLKKALASEDRALEDRQRDAGRKPAEVLAFLDVRFGMTVLDVIAAGGYYTEVLNSAVGPFGRVYAQNPERVLQMRDGANDKALTARLANRRLYSVIRLDQDIANLPVEPGSVDVAITALNLHDVYNNSPETAKNMLQAIKKYLKTGGVLGIIDHRGKAGADNKSLHRMNEEDAVKLANATGFMVTRSDLLSNPTDDHTKMVFAPEVRGKTDRFLLKLVKME